MRCVPQILLALLCLLTFSCAPSSGVDPWEEAKAMDRAMVASRPEIRVWDRDYLRVARLLGQVPRGHEHYASAQDWLDWIGDARRIQLAQSARDSALPHRLQELTSGKAPTGEDPILFVAPWSPASQRAKDWFRLQRRPMQVLDISEAPNRATFWAAVPAAPLPVLWSTNNVPVIGYRPLVFRKVLDGAKLGPAPRSRILPIPSPH